MNELVINTPSCHKYCELKKEVSTTHVLIRKTIPLIESDTFASMESP